MLKKLRLPFVCYLMLTTVAQAGWNPTRETRVLHGLALTVSEAAQTQEAYQNTRPERRSRALSRAAALRPPRASAQAQGAENLATLTQVPMPIKGIVRDAISSPNYQRYACVVEDNAAFYVVLDGQAIGPYDQIIRVQGSPYHYWTFSEDSKHFVVCVLVGGKGYLVVDGKRSSACEDIDVRKLHYSPQNESFACEARQGKTWGWLVHNGQTSRFLAAHPGDDPGAPSAPRREAFMYGSGYQSLSSPTPELFKGPGLQLSHRIMLERDPFFFVMSQNKLCLSQDHQHVFYRLDPSTSMAGFKAPVPCPVIIVDGRREGPYDIMRHFHFTPAGGHYGYMVQPERAPMGKSLPWQYLVDGKTVAKVDHGLRFVGNFWLSPDGRRFAYELREGRQTFIMANGKKFGPFTSVSDFQYAPAGEGYCALVRRAGSNQMGAYVLWNGRMLGPYEGIIRKNSYLGAPDLNSKRTWNRTFFWSRDGSRFAFRIQRTSGLRMQRGHEVVMVIDGEAGSPYKEVSPPFFSPDEKHITFYALPLQHPGSTPSMSKVMVLDGRELKRVSNLRSHFDHNSNLWSFVQGMSDTGREDYVLKNGERVFDIFGARWSCPTTDSRHLVSWTRGGFYVDGVPIPSELPPDAGGWAGQKIGLTLSNFDLQFGPSLPYTGDDQLVLFLTRGHSMPDDGHVFKLTISLKGVREVAGQSSAAQRTSMARTQIDEGRRSRRGSMRDDRRR